MCTTGQRNSLFKRNFHYGLTFILALGAIAFTEPAPDWINGSSMEYPREQYLIGVGMGDDRIAAEDRARAEISRIFSTAVTVHTSASESEQNLSKAGQNERNFSQTVSQNVLTASRKVLEGVDIVETWHDKTAAKYYALAVLERAKGTLALKDKIADFDKQILQWKQSLDQASGRLERVKYAMKLLALVKARAELNAELRVLDAGGQGASSPLDEAALRSQAAKALSNLDVLVDVAGAKSDAVETGIVQALNSFGLEAKTGGASQADIHIQAQVQVQPMKADSSGWKWARSAVTVSLKDVRTSKTFLRFDASERQASSDYDEALRRSFAGLAKKVAQKISEGITSYFENQ